MRPSPERLGRAVAWLLVPLVLVTLDAGCTLLPRRPAAPDAEVSGTGSIGPAPAPVPLGELPPLARTGEGPPSPQSVSVPPPVAEVGTTSGASDPAVRKVSGSSDPRAQAMVALLLDNDSEAPPPSPTEAEPIIAPAPVPTLTLETVEGPTAGPSSESEPPTATVDEALRHVDCLTCGGTGHLADLGTCLSCGGGGQCVPGRKPCYPYEYHTTVGRFFGMIYECLCCPDPCYEPTWVPEANAAFFVDYARPKTVTRIRYDFFNNLQFPDRAEYFWAEAALNRTGQPVGRGPTPPSFRYPNLRGMPYNRGFPAIDMSQVSLYTEAATKRAAFFFEFPYRSLQVIPQPPFNPLRVPVASCVRPPSAEKAI